MSSNTVLILGGGVGGVVAANELRARLDGRHRVVLVEKKSDFLFSPSLLWLMVGSRTLQQLTKPLSRMVRPGVELVQAEVREIDAEKGQVITSAALGDVAAITLANGRPLPRAGVFAHAEALAVARSLAAQLQGGKQEEFDGKGFCWMELGGGEAAFATGDFYAEPNPVLALKQPSRMLHWGKVLFEEYWMGDGLSRSLSTLSLRLGARWLGMKAEL